MIIRYIIYTGFLTLLLGGCFGGQRIEKDWERSIQYETVWVDPQIVFADSVITLISASRLDSIEVDPTDVASLSPPAVAFRVTATDCPSSLTLTDWRGELVRPLLVRQLPAGQYRLTLNSSADISDLQAGALYYLKADVCGRVEQASFVWERRSGSRL